MKHHIIHHVDPDGHAAAAVVYLSLVKREIDPASIHFVRINYGLKLHDEKINYDEDMVYVVDFCLQPYEQMAEMCRQVGDRMVWIDHHQTSIDCEKDFGLKKIAGKRSTSLSGCELTWKYFFPRVKMPQLLDLIGTWDTFRRDDKAKWDHEVLPLQTYLFSLDTRPHTNIGFWFNLLEQALEDPHGVKTQGQLGNLLGKGTLMHQYRVRKEDSMMGSNSYRGKFAGHTAVIANMSHVSSLMFERVHDLEGIDLMVAYTHVGGKFWRITMFTEGEDVDCGALAKRLGYEGPNKSGGGHRKAAGFQTDWEHLSSYLETEEGPLVADKKAQAEAWSHQELLDALGLVVISLRTKRDDCRGHDGALAESFSDAVEELDGIYSALEGIVD